MDFIAGYFDFSRRATIIQIVKFVVTGVANTAVDLIALNILLILFGVTPTNYAIFKTVAYLFALTNSYLLNKYWVFGKRKMKSSLLKERAMFVILSLVVLFLNSVISSWVFIMMTKSTFGFSPFIAANGGAVVGVLAVFLLNFFSYKFIVFRS